MKTAFFASHPHAMTKLSLGLILCLAAGLRFYDLGAESYWYDEIYTVSMAQETLSQLLAVKELNWPPAYYALIHFWVQLFGTTEFATRALSASAGLLAVPGLYLIGRELFGESVGLLSSFLLALSEFQIYYAQETRFYSLFLLATLSSLYFYLQLLKTGQKRALLVYGLSSLLLVFCHTFGVFVLAAQNLHFFLNWKKRKNLLLKWVACQTALFLSLGAYFLPIYLNNRQIAGAANPLLSWIPDPSLGSVLRTFYIYLFPLRYDLSWKLIFLNFVVGGLCFGAGLLIFTLGKKRGLWSEAPAQSAPLPDILLRSRDELLLVACWLGCPIVFPFLLSKIFGPMYLDRYTISAAPAFYLLIAFALVNLRRWIPMFVTLLTLVILMLPGLFYYYQADVKEQWRELAGYLDAQASPEEVLVFAPDLSGWQQQSFGWYSRGNFQTCGLGQADLESQATLSAALTKCLSGRHRFWLILRGTPQVVSRFQAYFLAKDRQDLILKDEKNYTGIQLYFFESQK